MDPCLENHKGYVLLMSVLIVAAVSLSIVLVLLFSGLIEMENSFGQNRIAQAQSAVYSCAEEALEKIIDANNFVGNGSLVLDDYASCQYQVIDLGGNNRQINATGTVSAISLTYYRKLKITVSAIRPKIIVSSWQETE